MTSSYLHRAMNISFWLPIVIAIGVTLASPAAVRSAEDDAASAETENEQVDDGVEDDDGDDAETRESGQARNFFRVVGSILGFGDSAPSQEDDATLTLLGEPAAGFELQTPEGETFRLNDQRGKVVVLDFWATWCGPCVAAMPKLQQLHDQFAERDVLVVGVNQQESAEEVTKFTSKKGFTFAQVLDDDGSVGDRFSVTGIPRTVVIDPQGIIQAIHSGYSPTLGKTLFDAEKVAAAKARLKKAQAQLLGDLQPIAPERLERIGTIDLGTTVSLSANYAPSWVRGDGNDHLVLHIDSDSLAILEPGSEEA